MKIVIQSGTRRAEAECRAGQDLLSVLRENGIFLPAGCGGRGSCGKCRVFVTGGRFGADGAEVLACKTQAEEGICVHVKEVQGGGLTRGESRPFACDGESGYGIAADIGTTTIAFALCDLSSGETLAQYACLNRQSAYGADVISRIMAAQEGAADALAEAVRSQLREAAAKFCAEKGIRSIKKAAVCGNTTMLHLLCGEDVSGIGKYPFTPAFTQSRTEDGAQWGLNIGQVHILPSVSAFVGADVVAGCVAAGLDGEDAMLADIGTNGEMIAHADGRFVCTSTAAGPCFEGANIECGMGGVAGAIDSVREEAGKIVCTVIGGGAPAGICGAGLVDAVALMLRRGVIDPTGAFAAGDRFYLSPDVFISQRDIRNFQLAKSAICAGIEILSERAGLSARMQDLYIAGGLGFYLNTKNALSVGLFPAENAEQLRAVGNAALAGTRACLLSRAAMERAERIAAEAEYIDLSMDELFMQKYIENMNF